uniref:Zinc finger and BTB domain containing 22b n=1 Tax=Poecilia reticulata TaxID=8081 RepID=A0A3P9N1U4_POERE
MQSVPMEVGSSSSSGGSLVEVSFPGAQTSVLDSLNRQREDGSLCDLSIHVQGHVFKAHRCVLAASSPYFHDQVGEFDPNGSETYLRTMWEQIIKEDMNANKQIMAQLVELLPCSKKVLGSIPGPGLSAWSLHVLPVSTNYFSPRDGSSFLGGGAAAGGASVDGGRASNTPSYCTPSGGEEALLIEEEEEEEEEEEVMYHHRKRGRGGGSGRRKKVSSVLEQEVGVSDSFGVSSYQDSEAALQKRPAYSQPSIMPRKQWVVVKTERTEDDDLIVVSGEEGGEDEEDEDERDMELVRERERANFNISNIRSLSAELAVRAESDMDSQVDYCQSSEDYLKFEGSLIEQTLAQHLHDSAVGQNQSANRAVSALLGQVQSAASARAQLFPLDMQGNQILLYSQASGLALDPAAPPLGVASGMMGGASFKTPGLEHGAVQLQTGLGPDGSDSGGVGGGAGGGSGGTTKVFMCHCGKTFTHKSMRDRHINMHLDLRPFHCPVCAKKFKMKHHLTEHMKTHTGLKPYDCLGCGKKFMWRDSFMRHRSHCERRGADGDTAGGGDGGRRGGGGGEEGPDFSASTHLLLSAVDGGQGGAARGGGASAAAAGQHGGSSGGSSHHGNNMAAAAGAMLGVVSQSLDPDHGSGMFGGLGLARGVCEEDVCEVSADGSSVT